MTKARNKIKHDRIRLKVYKQARGPEGLLGTLISQTIGKIFLRERRIKRK